MRVSLLDFTVPLGQYTQEAYRLSSDLVFENLSIQDAIEKEHDLVVVTDQVLPYFSQVNAKKKVIWLIEPPSIHPHIYQTAYNLHDQADLVFTHTKEFIKEIPNARYCPWGSYFIKLDDHKIYEKTKDKTIVASSKTQTEGHRLRHQVIDTYEDQFDCVRRGGTEHNKYQNAGDEYKLNFIKDYRFSVEIENASIDGYFTEKILDCFRTGTIPVYYGDPSILDHFDSEGVITFSNLSELENILPTLNKDLYEQKLTAVRNNFEKAEQFLYPWKHIWENGLNELL
tara:strand:- start:4747 stop:5598 length:852 start_codon:yes stop_codon:yes gene_type:complete